MSNGFAKVLSRKEVITLAFGAMIGWSWVLMSGVWLQRAGSVGTLLAFAIGGLAILLISLTYAELASAMPRAGGEHVYTHRAFGPGISFICTWALIMAYTTVPMFEATALPTAIEYLFPGIAQGYLWTIAGAEVHLSLVVIGISASLLVCWINVRGIKIAAALQGYITLAFLLVGVSFFVRSLGGGSSSGAEPFFINGAAGVMSVLIMVPALLVGFDVIPQSAEEINLPRREIGKWLVISVAMAVAWYGLITLCVALALEPDEYGITMGTAVANERVFGAGWAGDLMVAAGIAGMLTSWNAFIVGGSRVIYALARSGMLPPVFARLHPRYHTPYAAIWMLCGLCVIAPFFGKTILIWLVDTGSFAVMISFIFVCAAFLKLRRTEPQLERPFRVPHGQLVGRLALSLSVGIVLIFLPGSPSALIWPYEWVMVLIWVGLGGLLYRRSRHLPQPNAEPVSSS